MNMLNIFAEQFYVATIAAVFSFIWLFGLQQMKKMCYLFLERRRAVVR